MRIVGHRMKWQIASQQATATAATNQFSIKYLIGLTTAVALTLAIVRLMVGSNTFGNTAGVNMTFFARFIWICAVILLGTLPIPTVPILILSGRPTAKSLVLLFLAWAVSTLAAVLIVIALDRVDWSRITGDLLGFQLGGTIMSALAATFVRTAGYRLTVRP
jgi:hypothetical protein